MDVVCTAGHVDHGKSTLVRALTGMEPDRFAEERRRGLTIDIGFGWTDLGVGPDARTVAFVDLPGHERFIANMLAGAGPVEAVLFVVAADEGWKPQSQEHLEILDLLGVSTGVVAVTRADLAGDGVERAIDEVRGRLAGTTLEQAEVVGVSAVAGTGVDHLRSALLRALATRPPVADHGLPRLWVDRSFAIRGAGTVVTGTLAGGTLRHGDDVVVVPAGLSARVRGLQSLKSAVTMAAPGDRVAVNLGGVDHARVRRGDVVTTPGSPDGTDAVDVWLRVLPGRRLTRRGAWHLHAGSGEWVAAVQPLGANAVTGQGFARLLLGRPAALAPGERCILRDAGRRTTVAGGVVLDVDPPAGRAGSAGYDRVAALTRRLTALEGGQRMPLVELHVQERGADGAARTAAVVGVPRTAAAQAARAAGLLPLGGAWVHPSAAAVWAQRIREALAGHHAAHPLERWAPRDVALRAATAAGCPAPLAADLLQTLAGLGRVVLQGPGVRHPDHGVRLDAEQERTRDTLLAALDTRPFAPPPLEQAAAAAGASPALVRELEAAGWLVRLAPGLAMTARALDQAADRLRAVYADEGPLTAARAKEALGTTRKFALPLLEELDRRGVTRRVGDVRHLIAEASAPDG